MASHRKLVGGFGLAAALLLAGPSFADPPDWAPAHGFRAKQHRYIYYPVHQVYYAPERHAWFWIDGGRWRVGAALPSRLVVADAPGISVVLGTPLPYEQHVHVVETYGVRPYRVRWDDDDHHHRRHRHRHRHRHDD